MARNVYENLKVKLEFLNFGKESESEGMLYLDDGNSFDYTKGKYGLYKLNHSGIAQLVEGEGWN